MLTARQMCLLLVHQPPRCDAEEDEVADVFREVCHAHQLELEPSDVEGEWMVVPVTTWGAALTAIRETIAASGLLVPGDSNRDYCKMLAAQTPRHAVLASLWWMGSKTI